MNNLLTLQRAHILINKMIEHIAIDNTTQETIDTLPDIGFTKDELTEIFHFNKKRHKYRYFRAYLTNKIKTLSRKDIKKI